MSHRSRLSHPGAAIALLASLLLALAGAARGDDEPKLPPASSQRVDFESHVRPILQAKCLSCHARGKYKGGLSLETREALLKGGQEGPAAIEGKSGESSLIHLVAGLEEGRKMPQKGPGLTKDEIGLLRAWIDQGIAWPTGFTFGFRQAPLAPRKPEVPAAPEGTRLDNPIDRFIARSLKAGGASLDWTPIDDRMFARRASLDLVGLLPSEEQVEALRADGGPDKRRRFAESLLADRSNYAQHWMTFWNDALRNAYRGTGFIDGGRKTITTWLFHALYDNYSYDRFVTELVSPVDGSDGFTKGIVWRGVVNASQVPPVQAAQNVSQVFLGTNIKCASCHDSFVNHWKLADAYALASVFSDKPLEIHRCDKPTGQISGVGFVYPALGSIDASAPRAERLKRLSQLMTSRENGRFARTMVNRLWAYLLGRGLVEPLDDMDQPPWDQDLLDWLATDFVEHGHDIKHTLALITASRAYQLPSVGLPDPTKQGSHVFQGPRTRRMSAEQFGDAIASVTGVWPQPTGDMVKVDGRGQGGQVTAIRAVLAGQGGEPGKRSESPRVRGEFVWSHADYRNDPGGRVLFRKNFRVEKLPARALTVSLCDNEVVLLINGQRVGESTDWTKPVAGDVTNLLREGDNVIAAIATNWPDPAHGKGTNITGANPASFLAWLGGLDESGKTVWSIATDDTWLWNPKESRGWDAPGFESKGWNHAVELVDARQVYGNVNLVAALEAATSKDANSPIRAALLFDDPLLAALGRTNREQVVTRRESVATTLQALELINGSTLDRKLAEGARKWFKGKGREPGKLVGDLFRAALGRDPSTAEQSAALELVGEPATLEGVQDLLWALAMLPEFQLIR